MPLAKKKKRQYKNKETRRKEILRAASRLFLRKGFTATGIEDVVKAVGVSYGTFYYHFPTKMDLIQAFADSHIDKHLQQLNSWKEDASISPLAQIRRTHKKLERMRQLRLVLAKMPGGATAEDPAIYQALVKRFHGDISKSFADIIREGNRLEEFNCKDPDGSAVIISLLALDMVHYAATIKELVRWKQMNATYRATIDALLGI